MEQSEMQAEVWHTIQSMNRAWAVEGDANKLKNCFHKDMVAITATDRERLEGRDACIASWKRFVEEAKIHSWKEIDPKVQLYGNDRFAVVTYYFDMSFEIGGQTINLGGRDMFTLINENGKWWVVADQFSPYPQQ